MAKKAAKKKHAGGRPTKYKVEYATDEHVQGFIDHCREIEEVVTLCGYAVYIDVSEECLAEWRKTKAEFSETVRKIKLVSKNQLFQGGLNKKLSSKIVKLGLSANHGMSEKNITEHNVAPELQTVLGLINGSTKGQLPQNDPKDSSGAP